MKLQQAVSGLSVFAFASLSFAVAAEPGETFFDYQNLSMDMSVGSLSGKTRERVYDPQTGGNKISQLDWKYNNAAIVKGSVNWDIHPRMTFGASGWTTLAGRGADMVDTDWEKGRKAWTDQSRHPDTTLNYANEFDVNLKGWVISEPAYRLGVMMGYQESRYSFTATGGSYNYTDEETGLADTGTFPAHQRVIGYKQRFRTPYIGLTGSYRLGRLEFDGAFKFSPWVRATDNDEHYLRNITFKGKVNNQHYYSLTGSAGYYVTPGARIYLEGAWNRTTNKKGSISAHNYGDGSPVDASDSGIENYNLMVTAGLKYTF